MNARRYWTLLCCLAGLVSANTHPQEYPAKPIRIIIPGSPGGGQDIYARLIGNKLTEAWGQQIIIDNRAGAGGIIGSEAAAKAPADGYTLLTGHIGTLAVNPTLHPKLPYDPVKDFQPVTIIARVPSMLAVHPSLPVKSVSELISLARAKPGALTYGSPVGGAGHLTTAYFALMAKIELLHVPYRGTAPALIDLMAGQITLVFTGIPGIVPYVNSGKLRALGISGSKRLAILPAVPTVAESGLPGYEVTQWWGLLAPAGTPRPVVMKLHEAIVRALQSADIRQRWADLATEPGDNTPEEFLAFIKSEIARWAPVIKAFGAQPG